ncbi:hypothetical protein [Sorangium sp. So ce513]|uniref:hypothetical protein n=1 Tax=Sorangium sp. So ce513 TaxID=3133315 RepID=UPI003F61838B
MVVVAQASPLLRRSLGENAEALRQLERARDLHDELLEEGGGEGGGEELQGAGEGRGISWRERARLRLDLGDVLRRLGRLDEAERAYEEARARIARPAGRAGAPADRGDAADALRFEARVDHRLALVHKVRGATGEARPLVERAIARAREAGAVEETPAMYALLAFLHRRERRPDESWRAAREGLRVCRKIERHDERWQENVTQLLFGVAAALFGRGKMVGAERSYRQASRMIAESANPYLAGIALNGVGAVRYSVGDWRGARAIYQRALLEQRRAEGHLGPLLGCGPVDEREAPSAQIVAARLGRTHDRGLDRRLRADDVNAEVAVLLHHGRAERHLRPFLRRGVVMSRSDPDAVRAIAAWLGAAHDGRLDRRVGSDDLDADVVVLLHQGRAERHRRPSSRPGIVLSEDAVPVSSIAERLGVAHDGLLDRRFRAADIHTQLRGGFDQRSADRDARRTVRVLHVEPPAARVMNPHLLEPHVGGAGHEDAELRAREREAMDLGAARRLSQDLERRERFSGAHHLDQGGTPAPQPDGPRSDHEVLRVDPGGHGHDPARWGVVDALLDALPGPRPRPVAVDPGVGRVHELGVRLDRDRPVLAVAARRHVTAPRVPERRRSRRAGGRTAHGRVGAGRVIVRPAAGDQEGERQEHERAPGTMETSRCEWEYEHDRLSALPARSMHFSPGLSLPRGAVVVLSAKGHVIQRAHGPPARCVEAEVEALRAELAQVKGKRRRRRRSPGWRARLARGGRGPPRKRGALRRGW